MALRLCWFCDGKKIVAQYVFTYPCPKCGGTGLQVDAERREREHEAAEKEREARFQAAVAELRALREKEQGR